VLLEAPTGVELGVMVFGIVDFGDLMAPRARVLAALARKFHTLLVEPGTLCALRDEFPGYGKTAQENGTRQTAFRRVLPKVSVCRGTIATLPDWAVLHIARIC
jgi:hypothetical protein